LNRPSRAAVFALLARVGLTMQDYVSGKRWADSCLHAYSALLDYNTLDGSVTRPFSLTFNPELLFQCSMQNHSMQFAVTTAIDTVLYASYDSNDLRRSLFFRDYAPQGTKYFRGQYTGLSYLFCGLATDEVWLVRAECNARLGDGVDALADLNTLLIKRWKESTFVPFTAATADEALALILIERRKETLFRDLRWGDLRRLNQDPRFEKILMRVLDGQGYALPPNDNRYAYPIPDDEVRLGGVQQNP
jgi:hypothetical protein